MRLPLWVVPVAKLATTALVVALVYVGRQVFEPVVLPEVNPAVSVRADCPSLDSRGVYFWYDTFPGRAAGASQWALQLEVAGERSLSCGPSLAAETLRLTLVPDGHPTVVVRLDRWRGGASAVAIEVPEVPAHGNDWPAVKPSLRLDRRITEEEFLDLGTALDRSGAWSPYGVSGAVSSGSHWIIERRRGPAYNAAHRFAPGPGPFRDACLLFLKAADLEISAAELN
jgi:hypothetical protein